MLWTALLLASAACAAAWVLGSWDWRLFVGDNVTILLLKALRFHPKLLQATTKEDFQRAAWFMSQPIEGWARRLGYRTHTETVPVNGGEIPVFVARPGDDNKPGPLPLIVWFHGGAMVVGDAQDANLTKWPPVGLGVLEHFAGRAVICSVGYRLAPEHVFPTGVEDCIKATQWLQEHAERFGADRARTSVAGPSAGGYLAAAVHQAARDRSFPLASAVIIGPMLRRGTATKSWEEFGGMGALPRATLERCWSLYVPDPALASDPRCEPVRGVGRGDLAPCLMLTGDFDPLRDEGLEHLDALRRAGVAVEHVRARASHVGLGADREAVSKMLRWWSESLSVPAGS